MVIKSSVRVSITGVLWVASIVGILISPLGWAGGETSGGGDARCAEFSDLARKVGVQLLEIGQDRVSKVSPVIQLSEFAEVSKRLVCLPVLSLDRQARSYPALLRTELLVNEWERLSVNSKLRLTVHELAVLAGYEVDGQYAVSGQILSLLRSNKNGIENTKLERLCHRIKSADGDDDETRKWVEQRRAECLGDVATGTFSSGVADVLGRCTSVACVIDGISIAKNSFFQRNALGLVLRCPTVGCLLDSLGATRNKFFQSEALALAYGIPLITAVPMIQNLGDRAYTQDSLEKCSAMSGNELVLCVTQLGTPVRGMYVRNLGAQKCMDWLARKGVSQVDQLEFCSE